MASKALSDREIWIAANQTIKAHGDEAEIQAVLKSDYFLEEGDLDGHRNWLRIYNAIKELQNMNPTGPVN